MSLHKLARLLPLRHISIRVAWQDIPWDGRVCQSPHQNAACLILKNVRQNKDEARESQPEVAGQVWTALAEADLPPCVNERAGFMAPFELVHHTSHPYAETSPIHAHFLQTLLRHPPHSAACIPFLWMLREEAEKKAESLQLGYQAGLEDEINKRMGFGEAWVQHRENQLALLDTFFSAIVPDESLCFFYAKRTPLADDPRRTIVAVGRVRHVGEPLEYKYSKQGLHRAMIWDRMVQHSIRSQGGEGFVFPYHAILARAQQNPTTDPSRYLAFAPDESWAEFSYAAEHVTHDSAIAALLSCVQALQRIREDFEGPWDEHLAWLDGELNRLWKMRGAYPGLGAALTAFGVHQGNLLAHQIALSLSDHAGGWQANPWDYLDACVAGQRADPAVAKQLTLDKVRLWHAMTTRSPKRRALLELLSRFALSNVQASRFYEPAERTKGGIAATDDDLLANPYRLYELDRDQPDPVALRVIDRGLWPDAVVREQFPLPEPSALTGDLDDRRVRALVIEQLEVAARQGHSVLPRSQVIQEIRDLNVQPPCLVGEDVMALAEEGFGDEVKMVSLGDESQGYQLGRLARVGDLIRNAVQRRMQGKRHESTVDWRALLDAEFGPVPQETALREREEQARSEKAAALTEVYAARISVLVGPAGTGKTTVLKTLVGRPEVKDSGVLLLAPTGKARVRLEQQTGVSGAQTIAQFLVESGRYDSRTRIYRIMPGARKDGSARTIVIDEASMLTEEQLAAVIDAVHPPDRLILVGDPAQLPPIGCGRPFVDIVRRLAPDDIEHRLPRVAYGYAELTVVRRQEAGAARPDLQLAAWFSGRKPQPGTDDIWYRLGESAGTAHIKAVEWENPDALQTLLFQCLVDEIPDIKTIGDERGFGRSLGGTESGGYVYFNAEWKDKPGAAAKAEAWQVLSPVHGEAHGVDALNRAIQNSFRHACKEWAQSKYRKIPRPMGSEEILYGDKVINLQNEHRKYVYPLEGALQYVANGEIGMAVGKLKPAKAQYKGLPWQLEIEFSTQLGYKYSYSTRDFSEEGDAPLSLAYALTVHKTQGSEFGITFLILPYPCRLLSRELVYTALTRQRDKLILLHQGPLTNLRTYASDFHSETARRLTNLFGPPRLVEVEKRPFEQGLIHRTDKGDMVRSKSEVIIANKLYARDIPYAYEQELRLQGARRLPDFTIDDADTGRTIYWEHLGMLRDPAYRQSWEEKKAWYRSVGILPLDEDGGAQGTLVWTRDDDQGGIDCPRIDEVIDRLFGP